MLETTSSSPWVGMFFKNQPRKGRSLSRIGSCLKKRLPSSSLPSLSSRISSSNSSRWCTLSSFRFCQRTNLTSSRFSRTRMNQLLLFMTCTPVWLTSRSGRIPSKWQTLGRPSSLPAMTWQLTTSSRSTSCLSRIRCTSSSSPSSS